MLQRDWWVARMTPGRHMLGIYLKATGEPVGMADYAEEGPSEGTPWVGALLIARDCQRQGLGREAFEALAAHVASALGAKRLRIGVRAENAAGLAFGRALGCEEVGELADGPRRYVLLERELAD